MAEQDPKGKHQHEPGAKLDHGKLRPALVLGGFPRALEEVVRVGTAGANKYTDFGWKSVENGEVRYADAARRHQLEVDKVHIYDRSMDDYIVDAKSIMHEAQVIWNLLAALELKLNK